MNINELEALGILQWADIQQDYDHPEILLGNGFSISFSPCFLYNSLFTEFTRNPTTRNVPLFQHFNTPNFEEIMANLTHARNVNGYLGLEVRRIDQAINDLREGLVTTVGTVHPPRYDLDIDRINRIARDLDQFGNIYTTTYDAIPYYIILATNDLRPQGQFNGRYQDYFWGFINPQSQFREFRDFQNEDEYKHLFYLHGALFIYRGPRSAMKLIVTSGNDLLTSISDEIRTGRMPLFVSEGTANQKLQAINNSSYLSFCLRNLRLSNSDLLVYGMSFGVNDNHLVEAINFDRNRRLIFSVYHNDESTPEDLNLQLAQLRRSFAGHRTIQFVDYSSVFA